MHDYVEFAGRPREVAHVPAVKDHTTEVSVVGQPLDCSIRITRQDHQLSAKAQSIVRIRERFDEPRPKETGATR
jgi:hypothetical protein